MDEYIKRQDVLDEINEKISNIAFTSPYQDEIHIMVSGMERIRDSVEDAPAADVAPVVHGKWKFNMDGSGTCDQCNFTQMHVWDYDNWQNYCGVCGARMDGD